MLFGFLPQNLLELSVALLYRPYGMGDRSSIEENAVLQWCSLPVRCVLWLVCVALFYPVMLTTALFSAIILRLINGTAADILRDSLSASFKAGASYPCIFVFEKTFKDPERLQRLWKELAVEVGMQADKVGMRFLDEAPAPFPQGARVEADHYVDKGVSLFKRSCIVMSGWHSLIEINNGRADGDPTVMRCYFPGHTFDGTSCFNMGKELIARYYGVASKIVIPTRLTKKAAAKLDGASFAKYLLNLPYNVLMNVSDFNWNMVRSQRFFGGPGMSFELTMLNYTEDESKRMLAGLKRRGAKPFAGFIFAAFQAYKEVEKANPFALVQQVSMASRMYESDVSDAEFKQERRHVGDWLIGCLHHFQRTGDFTLADAMTVYETLLSDLKNTEGSVISAAMAKAYCPIGGAAVYEFFPFYGTSCQHIVLFCFICFVFFDVVLIFVGCVVVVVVVVHNWLTYHVCLRSNKQKRQATTCGSWTLFSSTIMAFVPWSRMPGSCRTTGAHRSSWGLTRCT
jgi:hypothetical protein